MFYCRECKKAIEEPPVFVAHPVIGTYSAYHIDCIPIKGGKNDEN